MAILARPVTQSNHWYRPSGDACHEVPKADGNGTRSTTIADARKLGLLPSVTNILGVLAKDGLTNWKLQKVAEAALANPKRADETAEYWVERVIGASTAETADASDHGTKIHRALEQAIAGEEYSPDARPYVQPVMDLLAEKKIVCSASEERVVNTRHGFAGTMDFAGTYGLSGKLVIDFKNQRSKPGKKMQAYDTYGLQLSAYAAGYWGEEALDDTLLVNILVSSTEPGRVEFYNHGKDHKPSELFGVFLNVCAIWRWSKNYDPRS
jgi:hypothetical protein